VKRSRTFGGRLSGSSVGRAPRFGDQFLPSSTLTDSTRARRIVTGAVRRPSCRTIRQSGRTVTPSSIHAGARNNPTKA
jgi:hypothetical protein